MNVTMEKTSPVNAIITVAVEENDYRDKVKKELRQIGQRYPEKGFRPGHVPSALLQRKYGREVLVEVVNRDAADALTSYVQDNKLDILGEPMLANAGEIDFSAGKDFTFKFDIGLAPEINLTIDKSVTIPYYDIEVDDAMVAERDATLRENLGKQVNGEEMNETALAKGSMVELGEDGAVKEGGITVESTVVSPQYFKSDEQKALFAGKKVGDEIVFNPWATCDGNATELSSMLNIDRDEATTKADFKMTVKEIMVIKDAEHDQEFFDGVFGKGAVTTEDEYTAKLKEMIASQFKSDSNYRFTIDAQQALTSMAGAIELPTDFLKKWLLNQDKDNKYTPENIDEEFTKMTPALVWQLIKEKAVKQLGIKVEDADILAEAKVVAQRQFARYGIINMPEDVIERYAKQMMEDKEQRSEILDGVVDDKLFKAIYSEVTVDCKTVPIAEFNALFSEAKS